MIATIVVSALTIVTNLILLIFKPTFTVKGKTINFYWIIPLIGAILLLSVGSISPADTITVADTAPAGHSTRITALPGGLAA